MKDKDWFHCGRCGHLFLAARGEKTMRRCTVCGEHPAPPVDGIMEWREPQTWSLPAVASPAEIQRVRHQKRQISRRRRRRANWLVVKLVIGWLAFTGFIVIAARWFWSNERRWAERATETTQTRFTVDSGEVNTCREVLKKYLESHSAAQRSQFVHDAAKLAVVISRHEAAHAVPDIPLDGLVSEGAQKINVEGASQLLLRWKSTDGKRFESVFRQQDHEWRLDWPHFVRYSEVSLRSFLEGEGPGTAEFRLLVRERLANERRFSPQMGVVFYEPRFGYPEEALHESQEFILERTSPDARLLASAWAAATEGRGAFGVKGEVNPPEMARVRVRLMRDEAGKVHLEQIIAAHWLSSNEPGFGTAEVSEPPAAQ